MSNVIAIVEAFNGDFKKSALEAVSYASSVAANENGYGIALVIGTTDQSGKLGIQGARKVIQCGSQIPVADNQSLAKVISDLAKDENASMIVMPGNSTSKGILGRLAVRLKSGCVSGVQGLPQKSNGPEQSYIVSRSVFAGKATARVKVSGPCVILGLSANACPVISSGEEVSVDKIDVMLSGQKVKLIETNKMSGRTPLPEAEIVVSAGRGMKDPANWNIIEDLATALGATTACSRPVADSHWRPHYEHVGQTGIAIKPNLYIAIGISGAIQHLAGVNNSKVIVVINKDPEAPFFKAADYGVCADLFDVVPKLTEAVKKFKHANT
jgi:electron transfer flavoprotein alpha subunit